jgi:hypothetical protein
MTFAEGLNADVGVAVALPASYGGALPEGTHPDARAGIVATTTAARPTARPTASVEASGKNAGREASGWGREPEGRTPRFLPHGP